MIVNFIIYLILFLELLKLCGPEDRGDCDRRVGGVGGVKGLDDE